MTYEERKEMKEILKGFDKLHLEMLLMINIEERFNWDAEKVKKYIKEQENEFKEFEEKNK